MGYPLEMINKDTILHAYVGVNAIEEEKSNIFNNYLMKANFNAKVMPLNIREDDIGFFINGFKDSKIKSGYFAKEYWQTLHNLLETQSDESKICGICDTIEVKDGQNLGSVIYGESCVSMIGENKTIAIYGNSATSKSILYHLVEKSPKEIILADLVVENCLEMDALVPRKIKSDIQRTTVDELKADVIIDSTNETIKIDDITFNYEDILGKIAEIKTKEWIENGRI
jgi:shikimate 5-dehydrogenase